MGKTDVIDDNSDGEPPAKKKKVDRDSSLKEIFNNFKHLDVYFINKQPQFRYYGYKLYFDEGIDLDRELVKKIDASIKFMVKNPDIYTKNSSNQAGLFSVSVRRFYEDEVFMSKWERFKENLKNFPEETLNCLGLALYQCVAEEKFKDGTINSVSLPKLRVKVFDYESSEITYDLQELHEKLLEIRGQVIKIERPGHQIKWLLFLCTRCFRFQTVKQVNEPHQTSPEKCQNCGKRKFKAQKDSPFTKSEPTQLIKLQYLASMEDDDKCQIVKTLYVKLLGDLVNTCSLKDNVTVVGVLKTCVKKSKKDIFATQFLCLEAVSLIKVPQPKATVEIELTEDDNSIIEQIRKKADIFPSLVKLFCPEIYGNERVKAGLLLSLFGGSESEEVKSNINVLLFGDSGVGKSVLVRTCAQIAPKGIYVNMTRSTLLGFNVKPKKNKQEPILESGALVSANGGCCVLDEFRKLSLKQSQDLFEVMESQSLCVENSGVNRSISVKTSVIVAAQPVDSKFNYKKTFEKNLDINKAILLRFDLIFMMLDRPDPSFEALKATHILKRRRSMNDPDQVSAELVEQKVGSLELISKLTLPKYIAYARRMKAELSEASAKIIENYFIEIKQKNYFNELLCHNRHFESLIRLTQARAKAELREVATEHDAEEVIKIHKFTIDTLKKVILSSQSKGRYKKAPSEDIRLYFRKVLNSDDSQNEQ